MDDEVVCDTCGDIGRLDLLAICKKCTYGAEHTYCMGVVLSEVPEGWTCQECMPRAWTNNELGENGRTQSSKASPPRKYSLRSRDHPNNLGDMKSEGASSGTSLKQTEKSPYYLRGKSPKLGSKMDIAREECSPLETRSSEVLNFKSKGQMARNGCLQKQKVEKTAADHDDKRENDHRTVATSAPFKVIHELCAGLALGEGSHFKELDQVGAAMLSWGSVIPKIDYVWKGKYLIRRSGRIALSSTGIQAHLSTGASPKVLEVVGKLQDTLLLEELPRVKIWPSQFLESQAALENIALYFFAKSHHSYRMYHRRLVDYVTESDVALKGIVDVDGTEHGTELLIFSSNVLPKKSRRWNGMLFLWGVFRGRRENNSSNTQLQNGDTVNSEACDTNGHLGDDNDMANVGAIPGSNRVLLIGESSNGNGGEENTGPDVADATRESG